MGYLEAEMTEIVEMEEHVVALNSTEAKTTDMKLLEEKVVVATETNTSTSRGRRQETPTLLRVRLREGHRDHNGGRAPAASIPNPAKLWESSVCSTVGN